MKKISVIVPMYYEEKVAEECYKRLTTCLQKLIDYTYEIIIIDDGSKDKTLEILENIASKDDKVKVISFSRNFGHQAAVTAGLKHVSGDAIIIIDADLQDPPELIPQMIQLWEQGNEIIYAKRKKRKGESPFKLLSAKLFYQILNALSDTEIPKDTGDFRLLDRRCVEALKSIRESQRYTKGLFSWIGYNKKEILYDRQPRAAGKTKWNYRKLINLSIDGITSFSTSPLRWSAILGIIISVVAFIYMLYIIIKTLVSGVDVPGYASTMVVILFLGGIQLIFLGVIGEYLGRAFYETKGRPLYFIDRYNEEKETNKNLNKPRNLL